MKNEFILQKRHKYLKNNRINNEIYQGLDFLIKAEALAEDIISPRLAVPLKRTSKSGGKNLAFIRI